MTDGLLIEVAIAILQPASAQQPFLFIIAQGLLNAYRFGNVLRVRVDDYEKFVQERKIKRDGEK
jgi:hypothetical protein